MEEPLDHSCDLSGRAGEQQENSRTEQDAMGCEVDSQEERELETRDDLLLVERNRLDAHGKEDRTDGRRDDREGDHDGQHRQTGMDVVHPGAEVVRERPELSGVEATSDREGGDRPDCSDHEDREPVTEEGSPFVRLELNELEQHHHSEAVEAQRDEAAQEQEGSDRQSEEESRDPVRNVPAEDLGDGRREEGRQSESAEGNDCQEQERQGVRLRDRLVDHGTFTRLEPRDVPVDHDEQEAQTHPEDDGLRGEVPVVHAGCVVACVHGSLRGRRSLPELAVQARWQVDDTPRLTHAVGVAMLYIST